MPEGLVTRHLDVALSTAEERDVLAVVLAQARNRRLDVCGQFQDIVMEMEWRLRDYLHLVQGRKPTLEKIRSAEHAIHDRNYDGMKLHAEIVDLERRITGLEKWMGVETPATPLTPDLVTLLFARLYDRSAGASDIANFNTLAAATLSILSNPRSSTIGPANLSGRFNWLGEERNKE